ncbi:TPA: hypothetical protein EYN23_05745 [Candidatus Poribacteria bacterium]|nr:hypothetical protein [Candidatus Poribacteria bacterium]
MKKLLAKISLFISLALLIWVYHLATTIAVPRTTIACSMVPNSSKNGYTWVCYIKVEDGDWHKLREDESK